MNYLLYGDVPLVGENAFGVGSSNPFLVRKLVLTEAGSAWLQTSNQGSPLFIRHPVELLHCPQTAVQAQFLPDRSISAQPSTPQPCCGTRVCKIDLCERQVKAHGLCQRHYMAERRSTLKSETPQHMAGGDGFASLPGSLNGNPLLTSPGMQVIRPQPRRPSSQVQLSLMVPQNHSASHVAAARSSSDEEDTYPWI